MQPVDGRAASGIVQGSIAYLHEEIAMLRSQASGMYDGPALEEALTKLKITLLEVEGDFNRQTSIGEIDERALEAFLESTGQLLRTISQIYSHAS